MMSSTVCLSSGDSSIRRSSWDEPTRASGGSGRDRCGLGARERELAVLRVDADRVALGEVALEQPQRRRVLDQALSRALQRARARKPSVSRFTSRRRRS